MWLQFFLENAHFAINLSASFVLFAVAWLYFDAWLGRKNLKEGIKVLGLTLLSVSFLIQAVFIESVLLDSSLLGGETNELLVAVTRIPGYLMIILSLILDPLQPKPSKKLASKHAAVFGLGSGMAVLPMLGFLYPFLAGLVGFLYLRRATIGLENHLKAVSLSFFILSAFELVSLFLKLQISENIDVYNLVAPFGYLWIFQHVVLLIFGISLGRWVFGYLLKRIQSQLFMIFTASILAIFLLTTVSFTALLLRNLEQETLKQLETDAKVLNFAVNGKKELALSDAQVLSQNPQVILLVKEKKRPELNEIASSVLLAKSQSFLIITSDSGQVLARGEDKERVGDSLSDDPLVKRALLGESVSSVISKEGALAPAVSVRAAVPVKEAGVIIGTIVTGLTIDSAFVDGIKSATGLETAIYGDNRLSATTILASDGKSRSIGIEEKGERVKGEVLRDGKNFSGAVSLLNVPYFAAYLPIKDIDNGTVGMLFVGKPQIGVLQAAGKSIEMTFMLTVLLLILSIVPSYFISRYLSSQMR